MIRVDVSRALIDDWLRTGQRHKFEVTEGLPPGAKLVEAVLRGGILMLYFAENDGEVIMLDEVKPDRIECRRIDD